MLVPALAAERAMDHVLAHGARGCWIHLDTDILDDAVNPAVDYRLAGGLAVAELGNLLRALCEHGNVIGMDVTIYNPSLDEDGRAARAIVDALAEGLRPDIPAPAQ